MIFVSVGTVCYPFERFADFINRYSKLNTNEKFVVQSGYTRNFKSSKNVRVTKFMAVDDVVKYIKNARLVIVHGGEGSIYTSLKYAINKPYVFPRSSKLKEHVDDQQLFAVSRLVAKKMISVIDPLSTNQLIISKNKFLHLSSEIEDQQIVEFLEIWTKRIK